MGRHNELRSGLRRFGLSTRKSIIVDDDEDDETGSQRPQTQITLDDEELLERALNAENSEKFRQLWIGNTAGYPSHSEADQATFRTFSYGIMMGLSAFLLWGFYLTAYCVIRVELGANRLTNMLYLFWWVLVIIIGVILSIQLEQMLIERLRVSLVAYLVAIGLGVAAVEDLFQVGLLVRVVAGVMAVVIARVGLASQRSVRSASQDNQGAGTEDADEGMESLDSVYK